MADEVTTPVDVNAIPVIDTPVSNTLGLTELVDAKQVQTQVDAYKQKMDTEFKDMSKLLTPIIDTIKDGIAKWPREHSQMSRLWWIKEYMQRMVDGVDR